MPTVARAHRNNYHLLHLRHVQPPCVLNDMLLVVCCPPSSQLPYNQQLRLLSELQGAHVAQTTPKITQAWFASTRQIIPNPHGDQYLPFSYGVQSQTAQWAFPTLLLCT